jgi:hypothetical protein
MGEARRVFNRSEESIIPFSEMHAAKLGVRKEY